MRLPLSVSMIAVFGAAALGVPAFAEGNEQNPSVEAAAGTQADAVKPVAKEEKKICKTIDATGSRTGAKKVCMTRAEWKKVDM